MDKKNQVLMTVLGVFALVIVTIGVSYAFFSYTRTGTTESTIKTTTGEISFIYSDDEAGVNLTDAVPLSATQGKALTDTYDFSVAANMSTNATITYTVTAVNTTGTPEAGKKAITDSQVRAYLTDDAGTALWTTGSGDNAGTKLMSEIITTGTTGELYKGTLTTTTAAAAQSKAFKLRIWLDSSETGGNINASDTDGDGVITEGDNFTVDENGEKVTATTTNGVYSLKLKVTANAVSNQS